MRVLALGSDRSQQGILFPDTKAAKRQVAYAKHLGELHIIGLSLVRDGARPYEQENVHVHPTNSLSRLTYAFDAFRIATKLPKPDIITVQDPFEVGLVALLLSRRFKVPLHVQVHTDAFAFSYTLFSPLNFVRTHLALYVLKKANGIRVVSEKIKGDIEVRMDVKCPLAVLPIYVDVERVRTAVHDAGLEVRFAAFGTKVLVVARLEAEKNVALALHAFKESAPPDSCLIIVGQGREEAKLKVLCGKLGLDDRVFFEGTKDTTSYYKMADLILVTSRYEGYGMVIVEALAAGKPVLSTDVGIAREAGAIVTSEEGFGRSLAHWFSEGPRRGELSMRSYGSFEEYASEYAANIRATLGAI